jgi:hypothetical protein
LHNLRRHAATSAICPLCNIIQLILYAIAGTTTTLLAASISHYITPPVGRKAFLRECERNVQVRELYPLPLFLFAHWKNGHKYSVCATEQFFFFFANTDLSNTLSMNFGSFIKLGTKTANSSAVQIKFEQYLLQYKFCSTVVTILFHFQTVVDLNAYVKIINFCTVQLDNPFKKSDGIIKLNNFLFVLR